MRASTSSIGSRRLRRRRSDDLRGELGGAVRVPRRRRVASVDEALDELQGGGAELVQLVAPGVEAGQRATCTWNSDVVPGLPLGRPAVMPTRSPVRTQPSSTTRRADGVDQLLRDLVARQRRRLDPPHQPAAADRLAAGREREDRHRGPVRGDEPRRAAGQRRAHERGEAQLARRAAGEEGDRVGGVALVAAHALLVEALVRELRLRVERDRRHHLDRLDRVGADRRLLRQHHRVGAVEDRVGDVGHFSARRPRRGDHRVQHLRRRDHGPRHPPGHRDDLLLDDRHLLDAQLDAEVAARDHHAVRGVDDLLEPVDRLRLLDLGDQRQPGVLAQLGRPPRRGARRTARRGRRRSARRSARCARSSSGTDGSSVTSPGMLRPWRDATAPPISTTASNSSVPARVSVTRAGAPRRRPGT